jgi:HK97 family phage prohead protease
MGMGAQFVICRAAPVALEPVGDGWTVGGMPVPYEVEQTVTDDGGVSLYVESVARGAFRRDIEHGGHWINLMLGHAGDEGERYLGKCTRMADGEAGPWLEFRLNRSHPRAEEARSGELTGWSISAKVYKSREVLRGARKVIVRESLNLSHVAATAAPQYAGAGVLVTRGHELVEAPGTPLLDRWRSRGYGKRV